MPNHGKTLDTIVAKAIIAIVASLGNGPVEQLITQKDTRTVVRGKFA